MIHDPRRDPSLALGMTNLQRAFPLSVPLLLGHSARKSVVFYPDHFILRPRFVVESSICTPDPANAESHQRTRSSRSLYNKNSALKGGPNQNSGTTKCREQQTPRPVANGDAGY